MSPQKFDKPLSSLRLRFSLPFVVLLAVCFSLEREIAINPSKAQNPSQESPDLLDGDEKKLEEKIPGHLPIKVKVKNLNKKRWAEELEVEVTNTSDKPIYFLNLHIILSDIKTSSGNNIGFPLRYGRIQLIDFTAPLEATDVPIKPGETYTFKIPELSAKGWSKFKIKENKREPKKLQLIFQTLNFGDGTGYSDAGGSPINIHKKVDLNRTCVPPPDRSPNSFIQSEPSLLPASFLPVKFSVAEIFLSHAGKSGPQSSLCCPGTPCSFYKQGYYTCERSCNPTTSWSRAQVAGCEDPQGLCLVIAQTEDTCVDDDSGLTLTCFQDLLYPCADYGGPENTDARCSDGIDNDGDGNEGCKDSDCFSTLFCCPDIDGDGHKDINCGGDDCDDTDHLVFPGKPENCRNGGKDDNRDEAKDCQDGDCLTLSPFCAGCRPGAAEYNLCQFQKGEPDPITCDCKGTPILIDVLGNGFALTNAQNGIRFDLNIDGKLEKLSWTNKGSDDAWLVLDRNGNGKIDDGTELFGNFTPQNGPERNGFIALAEFDKSANGGNKTA